MKLFLATQTGSGFTGFLPPAKLELNTTNCFLCDFLIFCIVFHKKAAQEFDPIVAP